MAYIGKQPVVGNFVKLDAITTSATATYNLLNGGTAYFPQTANNCIVSLNGVIQSPTSAYTISGSTIVFDSALTSLDTIDFILVLGDVLAIGTPSDGTVTSAKLASGTTGLIAWQSILTAATLTAVSGRGYWIDTTSNACTVTLPASATAGDTIILVDYARKWGTNAVTINQNSLNFQGGTTPNPIYNTNNQSVTLVYSGATKGWIPTVDDDVTFETPQPYSVDFLIVAGGGGGGNLGGGGGAGGYRTSTQSVNVGTVITVTVGDGGAGWLSGVGGGFVGSNSSISGSGLTTITSAGGGGSAGGTGGSGGSGAGGGFAGGASSGGLGNTPSTSPSQGNNGGDGGNNSAPNYPTGGGGGAGAVGGNASGGTSGSGGAGTASSITGSSVTRAGGGGGGSEGGTAGTGGSGGGGAGSNNTVTAISGTANTGGGGGGGGFSGSSGSAGSGGKGVVILSVPTASYSGTSTGSPTITTSGANTILQFNGSGSYTG